MSNHNTLSLNTRDPLFQRDNNRYNHLPMHALRKCVFKHMSVYTISSQNVIINRGAKKFVSLGSKNSFKHDSTSKNDTLIAPNIDGTSEEKTPSRFTTDNRCNTDHHCTTKSGAAPMCLQMTIMVIGYKIWDLRQCKTRNG